jgi:hypothetical protein
MGGRRVDRLWPRPRRTRHVWIKNESTLLPPTQGLVLEWRRQAYKWAALVLFVHEEPDKSPIFMQQWFPVERLRPVQSDPNDPAPHY